ncbi:MAG: response regulator [Chloroflexota bacterium]
MVVYTIIAAFLFPVGGAAAGAFVMLPAIVAGWYYTPRFAFIFGWLTWPFNGLFFMLLGSEDPFGGTLNGESLVGTAAVALIGYGAGQLAKLGRRLQHEVAERKQAQEALNQANEQLQQQAEQAAKARNYFLTAISHQLRTPMNAALGMNTLLLDSKLDPKQREYAEEAYQGNQDTIRIINTILEYTKAESGAISLEQAPFHLSQCIHNIYTKFLPQANAQQVTLSLAIDPSVPATLVGDEKRIALILGNIFSHILHAKQEGQLSLSVTQTGTKSITENNQEQNYVRLQFTLHDHERKQDKATFADYFEPFQQRDDALYTTLTEGSSTPSTAFANRGAGIGLALCRALCELMNGDINIQRVPNAGTAITFTMCLAEGRETVAAQQQPTANMGQVSLPKSSSAEEVSSHQMPQPSTQAASTQAASTTISKQIKKQFDNTLAQRYPFAILLAEDNRLNAKVAQRILQRFGYKVDWVKDGQEALDAVQDKTYDLILMDIQMPNLNGLEATQCIRSLNGEVIQPYIIAVTADTTLEDSARWMDYGLDGYIGKPLAPAIMMHTLEKAWHNRRAILPA